jgi:hypothetical protein
MDEERMDSPIAASAAARAINYKNVSFQFVTIK